MYKIVKRSARRNKKLPPADGAVQKSSVFLEAVLYSFIKKF